MELSACDELTRLQVCKLCVQRQRRAFWKHDAHMLFAKNQDNTNGGLCSDVNNLLRCTFRHLHWLFFILFEGVCLRRLTRWKAPWDRTVNHSKLSEGQTSCSEVVISTNVNYTGRAYVFSMCEALGHTHVATASVLQLSHIRVMFIYRKYRNERISRYHPRLLFVGWYRSCVPSWRLYAGYRRWPPSLAVCWQSNMPGQEVMQPVRWPLFGNCRANAVEQSAWTASATGHHLRTIQTIVENVYVWLVWQLGPRRPVSD